MKASDIMTTGVVTAGPETSVLAIANLLIERGISAVPIVSADGALMGIVSEGDLLRRAELGTEQHRSWWSELVASNTVLAAEYVKTHGRKAKDVMSKDVISVGENATLAEIAGLLEARRIKRVPVVRGGKLVGIVSRANLLRALASTAGGKVAASADDGTIRDALLGELRRQKWAGAAPGNIIVSSGVVHLWGTVISEAEKEAMRVAAENVAGVKAVEDHTIVMSAVSPM